MTITLNQFQAYELIEEPTQIDMLRCFLDMAPGEIDRMKVSDVADSIEAITEALEKKAVFTPTFKLDGVEYGFIPNLDEITYGENRDMIEYVGKWQTMHQAMAVVYRPIRKKIKGKYVIEEYTGTKGTADLMGGVPLDIVQGMNVFFYNLINDLLNCIPKYMVTELEKAEALEANGEAIMKSILLVKETLQGSTK